MSIWRAACWFMGHSWVYPKGRKYRRCSDCDLIERLPE